MSLEPEISRRDAALEQRDTFRAAVAERVCGFVARRELLRRRIVPTDTLEREAVQAIEHRLLTLDVVGNLTEQIEELWQTVRVANRECRLVHVLDDLEKIARFDELTQGLDRLAAIAQIFRIPPPFRAFEFRNFDAHAA